MPVRSSYLVFEKDEIDIDHYRIPNPKAAYDNKQPEFINMAFERDGYIYAPRNLSSFRYDPTTTDNTTVGDPVDFPDPLFELKPFQQELRDQIDQVFDSTTDQMLKSPCGSGKTIMAMDTMRSLGRKATILVPNSDLVIQWKKRFERFMPEVDLGILDGRYKHVKDVTIASIPTVANLNPHFNDLSPRNQLILEQLHNVGTLVTDESHRLGADHWVKAIGCFPATYRFSVTATPERSDGMSSLLYAHLGKVQVSTTLKRLAALGQIVLPEILLIRTGVTVDYKRWDGTMDYAKCLTALSENLRRNRLLYQLIQGAQQYGRKTLSLLPRNNQIRLLYEHFTEKEIRTGIVRGKTRIEGIPQMDREDALCMPNILANVNLAKEGLDLPELDTLFMATPLKDPGVVEQITGRLCRVHIDKRSPKLADLIDTDLSLKDFLDASFSDLNPVEIMARRRIDVYRSLGCKISCK